MVSFVNPDTGVTVTAEVPLCDLQRELDNVRKYIFYSADFLYYILFKRYHAEKGDG